MSRPASKPVIFVAIALLALIVVPLVLLVVANRTGAERVPSSASAGAASVAIDYDLQQLADRAEELLQREMPAAVQEGAVSLDFVAGLERLREKAEDALGDGKLDRAKKHYGELVARAEASLAAIALADEAKDLRDSVLSDLRRLERFKGVFEQTYTEAVGLYDEASSALAEGEYAAAVEDFRAGAAVLEELEAQVSSRVESFMAEADSALGRYDFEAARSGYGEVLRIDPEHEGATAGIRKVDALAELGAEVRELEALENGGRLDDALALLSRLESSFPENPYLADKRSALEGKIAERDFNDLVASAGRAERQGDFEGAIEALEKALEIRPDPEMRDRIAVLVEKRDAALLEALLATAYDELKEGRYEEARESYREALVLAPDSKEAKTGFEKASSLYFASIRFRENLANAAAFMAEGRFPLAAKFFNDAMASRPASLPESVEEREVRQELERQSREVPVSVLSDKRTYVSLIGVFPPERFDRKDLRLYPDVYTFRGTRRGYRDVEIVLKVNARNQSQEIEVKCREKQ